VGAPIFAGEATYRVDGNLVTSPNAAGPCFGRAVQSLVIEKR
jgi:hypothetical protein